MPGQPGQVGWATPQLDRLTGAGGDRPETALRAGDGGRKGPRGSGAHPNLAGGVGVGGGRPVTANSAAAASSPARRNGDAGGFSGRGDPIPCSGKQ
jgi:hypothetical protein